MSNAILTKAAMKPCTHQVASTSCRGVRSARVLVANRRVFSAKRCSAVRAPAVATVQVVASDSETLSPYSERFRLNNLSPQEGSRKERNRKGRGYGAGQGGSCGFGMRGQKSRSGPGIRTGFEGGQTPIYRRLPKLKGIAGGMPKGRKKFVTVNLKDVSEKFAEGEVVSLESLRERRVLSTTGKEAKLPLKILGEGEIEKPLVFKAAKFSKSALEKIEQSDASFETVPMKRKWTRKWYEQQVRAGKIIPKSKFWKVRFEFEKKKAAEAV